MGLKDSVSRFTTVTYLEKIEIGIGTGITSNKLNGKFKNKKDGCYEIQK